MLDYVPYDGHRSFRPYLPKQKIFGYANSAHKANIGSWREGFIFTLLNRIEPTTQQFGNSVTGLTR